MARDNSTGKDKAFYERGKEMFDRILTVKTSSDGAAAVDQEYPWLPIDTCPVGRKVQLVNKKMGCATYGIYSRKDTYWTHWAPLPKFMGSI